MLGNKDNGRPGLATIWWWWYCGAEGDGGYGDGGGDGDDDDGGDNGDDGDNDGGGMTRRMALVEKCHTVKLLFEVGFVQKIWLLFDMRQHFEVRKGYRLISQKQKFRRRWALSWEEKVKPKYFKFCKVTFRNSDIHGESENLNSNLER